MLRILAALIRAMADVATAVASILDGRRAETPPPAPALEPVVYYYVEDERPRDWMDEPWADARPMGSN